MLALHSSQRHPSCVHVEQLITLLDSFSHLPPAWQQTILIHVYKLIQYNYNLKIVIKILHRLNFVCTKKWRAIFFYWWLVVLWFDGILPRDSSFSDNGAVRVSGELVLCLCDLCLCDLWVCDWCELKYCNTELPIDHFTKNTTSCCGVWCGSGVCPPGQVLFWCYAVIGADQTVFVHL